jgi:hypothetical protein
MKVITLLVLLGMMVLQGNGGTREDNKAASQQVPPYHNAAPRGREAAALDVREFAGDPKMKVLYGQANRVRKVLYQLPCYCKCSRYLHHGSLLACYREKHATTCDTCQKESIYAFEQAQAGKSVEQIRQEIVKGAWKDIDVDAHVAAQQNRK